MLVDILTHWKTSVVHHIRNYTKKYVPFKSKAHHPLHPGRRRMSLVRSLLDSRNFPFLSISFSAPSLHWLENHHLLPLSPPDSTNSVTVTEQQAEGCRSYLVILLVTGVSRGEWSWWDLSQFPCWLQGSQRGMQNFLQSC